MSKSNINDNFLIPRQLSIWSNPFEAFCPPNVDNYLQELLKSNEVVNFPASSAVMDLTVICLRLIYAVETFAKSICPIAEIVGNDDDKKLRWDEFPITATAKTITTATTTMILNIANYESNIIQNNC